MSQVLSILDISVELQNKSILTSISFALEQGDILGLVGPSGCGKTTLLNTLAGFIKQVGGTVNLGSQAITPEKFIEPEHRHIGMIFQDYALFPHLTVAENISFGIQKQVKSEQETAVAELLSLLSLDGLANRFPHQLSGGQQQRVAIARALAPKPKLLLLDEPFSNIDARLRNDLMIELRRLLKNLGMTAIFVTHNKDEVFTFADKIAILEQGQLLQFGQPREVCAEPNSFKVADFLQLGSWLPAKLVQNHLVTAIGKIPAQSKDSERDIVQLLVKPQALKISQGSEPNAKVSHISVTEQGFHYLFSNIEESELAFSDLSVYSSELLSLEQEVTLALKPHQAIYFSYDKDQHTLPR